LRLRFPLSFTVVVMMNFTAPPLGTSRTARELELSESRVRQLAVAGRLRASRTDSGQYLFDPADVASFRIQRPPRRDARSRR
jgi:hypothetical protein